MFLVLLNLHAVFLHFIEIRRATIHPAVVSRRVSVSRSDANFFTATVEPPLTHSPIAFKLPAVSCQLSTKGTWLREIRLYTFH